MIVFAWIGMGAVLLFQTSALAASFDCTRAGTPHERHICGDPALSAADTRLGEAYRSAVTTFPIKSFVQATQRRFLVLYPLCDEQSEPSCASLIDDRIAALSSMNSGFVYSNVKAKQAFSPDDSVFWMATHDGQTILHYFGSYMPDMNKPEPFPAGFVCDGSVVLRKSASGWTAVDTTDEVSVTNATVVSQISCSPRNGLFGSFARVR